MRILVVSPLMPFPLVDGGRKAVFYPIKCLAERGHKINLACLAKSYDARGIEELGKYCEVNVVINSSKPTLGGALAAFLTGASYDLSRFHNSALLEEIKRLLSKHDFDIVQLEGIHAGFFGLAIKREFKGPVVMRVVHVHSINMERQADQTENAFLKAYLRYEIKKVKAFETQVGEMLDMSLAISEHDRQVVLGQNPRSRCETIPAGVDLATFVSTSEQPVPGSVLWMGALDWRPNQDSFWWFFTHIFPLVVEFSPSLQLTVVGSNPPSNILAIEHPNVQVLGHVEDVREHIQLAQVCVVPLRIGSGIRIKLLEMFAMRKAVVSTSVGCEGLSVNHGEHLLIADEPRKFADEVVRLLADSDLRVQLATNGFEYVRKNFAWERIAQLYEDTYLSLLKEKRNGQQLQRSHDHD